MILLVGATGLVGQEVAKRLLASGKKIRALTRAGSDAGKVDSLRAAGVEIAVGDLKNPETLPAALRGIDVVVSTATCTTSRQDGDDIESVDRVGQIALIDAAKAAGVKDFVFTSYRNDAGVQYSLTRAKRDVESHLKASGLNYTIIQASWFMEFWLSPAMGFAPKDGKVRLFGTGENPVSYVSYQDVAAIVAAVVQNPKASKRVIEFGGPEAVRPSDVVKTFEKALGKTIEIERVSEAQLESDMRAATVPLYESFSGLMWQCARGDEIDMKKTLADFPMRLTSVADYAKNVAAS